MDGKELDWQGSSKKDLMSMPNEVRRNFGYGLGLAQNGRRHDDAKTLTGFRPTTIEILEDDDGDTYRAVYTAHFDDVVYVLHCFKKKSTKGRNLPRPDKATIEVHLTEVRKIEAAKAKARRKSS